MKTTKIIIALVCVLLACNSLASGSMEKRTESWLQKSPAASGGRIDPGTNPETDDPEVGGPIGEGSWLLFGFSLCYGVYLSGKKKAVSKIDLVQSHDNR